MEIERKFAIINIKISKYSKLNFGLERSRCANMVLYVQFISARVINTTNKQVSPLFNTKSECATKHIKQYRELLPLNIVQGNK